MIKFFAALIVVLLVAAVVYFKPQNPSSSHVSLQPAQNELESALQPPPVANAEGQYPAINQKRLYELAGQPQQGPSYKVTPEEFQQMVAEQTQTKVRVPANDDSPPQVLKKKKSDNWTR